MVSQYSLKIFDNNKLQNWSQFVDCGNHENYLLIFNMHNALCNHIGTDKKLFDLYYLFEFMQSILHFMQIKISSLSDMEKEKNMWQYNIGLWYKPNAADESIGIPFSIMADNFFL